MRAVVQRVKRASVSVDTALVAGIEKGLLVLLGVARTDTQNDIDYICKKLAGLRIFDDAKGKLNLSAAELGLSVLLVSQFTLYGDTRHGNRPSFMRAALPETAEPLYEKTAQGLRELGLQVKTGVFGAMMDVELVNDGPVTILLESERLI